MSRHRKQWIQRQQKLIGMTGEDVAFAVKKEFGIPARTRLAPAEGDQGRLIARIAAYLMRYDLRLSAREVNSFLGLKSSNFATLGPWRIAEMRAKDPEFRDKLRQIRRWYPAVVRKQLVNGE